mmetsp:Transcript_31445/g.43639  ORF Transcript_31445/g.43639 Transcript_31445/m.43639 type:complete len:460 (+) Transcript_31445:384-1763(+)|eukprot:CAMPEP_0196589478 /NCGR_PEP_ID=MMETSP1081-20130531/63651_1 /TAXON_ID=36882 /ORGANISM="Pyramimonas amylifera, Strain CCMP720" /LENGTH=459 /DNA_ID=CAMNT_0041912289 /DNA_START=380 /DNA_END=1759 /DNA_ORIENTATION=-
MVGFIRPLQFWSFVVALLTGLGDLSGVLKCQAVSIEDFGAVPDDSSLSTAVSNSRAIELAFQSLEAKGQAGTREVEVPAGRQYFLMPVNVKGSSQVTFVLRGTLIALDAIDDWPMTGNHYHFLLNFVGCKNVTVSGGGEIRGRGFKWWARVILDQISDHRPHLLYFFQCSGVLVESVRMYNSPMYHLKLEDVEHVVVRNVTIHVDTTKQASLLTKTGKWDHKNSLPLFPLNTDGIDPSGKDIHIYNISVTNFDDVVAVKPSYMEYGMYANCTENVLVEDAKVRFGVGMTVGTVGPSIKGNCVRNVTFRNVEFLYPFKAIYIKTNPGDAGFGIIDNITYEDIFIKHPIWWSIYVGPQQQKQPDGSGPGCMMFPIMGGKCSTQPLVTISNVVLRNIRSIGNVLGPGIIRCDEANPCKGFVFSNVTSTPMKLSPFSRTEWYCENVQGVSTNSIPEIPCFKGP